MEFIRGELVKKKVVLGSLLLILILVFFLNAFQFFTRSANSNLLSDLEGTIYFTERVDGVLTLFKSDASLQHKALVYSHNGKGNDGYGDFNHNIIDFHYDRISETFTFIAMNNGSWSLFSLKEGESNPTVLQADVMEMDTDYLQNENQDLSVASKKGSLYLSENGNESILKKFNGIYDEKFTGYDSIGFSPNGNYLVYRSMEHFTPIGTILEGIFADSVGNTYILDLSTRESTKFIDAHQIQWVMD